MPRKQTNRASRRKQPQPVDTNAKNKSQIQIKKEETHIQLDTINIKTEGFQPDENAPEISNQDHEAKTEIGDQQTEEIKNTEDEDALFWEETADNDSGEEIAFTDDEDDFSDDEVADPSYEVTQDTSLPPSPEHIVPGNGSQGTPQSKYCHLMSTKSTFKLKSTSKTTCKMKSTLYDPASKVTQDTSPPASPEHTVPGKIPRGRPKLVSQTNSTLSKSTRTSAPPRPGTTEPWNTEGKEDICPAVKNFHPSRAVGHQLNPRSKFSPLELFKLFVSESVALKLCNNTNKQAAKRIEEGKKFSWTKITTVEFFKYVGLTFFFSLVKLPCIFQYWKIHSIFSQPFPRTVMARDRYRNISCNIHMSDPDEDKENDSKKGTPAYDKLFRLKPLMGDIQLACRTYYQARMNISIDERMVASKARTSLTQYVKAKPTKWGYKLFVLVDSSNGYTMDFNVCTGKWGMVANDSVMTLVKRGNLGSGYTLYMDSYYTSPKLLRDLYRMNIGACGTYRDNRRGCPRSTKNALQKTDPKGTIRWIRDDPVVFVKWMDNREVSICSTVHQAYSGQTIQRRLKQQDGSWAISPIPCPTPVIDYYKNMGGVDLSDQLIQYYSVHHRTMRWYKTFLFHFLDIAATNSYLLHKELCKEKHEQPLSHRAFLEELTTQLCGVTVDIRTPQPGSQHVPVAIAPQTDTSKLATAGRRGCVHCKQIRQKKMVTPWKCKACDVALCLILNRNCFEEWHK